MSRRRIVLLISCTILLALWLGNTSSLVALPDDRPHRFLAHRAVHQIYAGAERTVDTCTAGQIAPPTHDHIGNTIPSIQAAFDHGAEVVEVDVHLTRDGVFAVFHDGTLDCQTDGTGVTHEQTFAHLRTLDPGYGHTADGQTFPLRGKWAGQIPSLRGVLDQTSGGQLLINFKSNRVEEGHHLARLMHDADLAARVYGVNGSGPPTRAAQSLIDGLAGFDRGRLKSCLLTYVALGWSGYVPQPCRTGLIAVPMDYAPYLWGWPHRFTQRMTTAGTEVILWGPYDGSGFSSGVDDADALARVPDRFDGLIWTNRIERLGPR